MVKARPLNHSPSYSAQDSIEGEERKGLLSGKEELGVEEDDEDLDRQSWSQRKIVTVAVVLIILLLSGALMQHVVVRYQTYEHPNLSFHGDYIRSNGTHDFKRTVLIVSIDGLRADYLDRGLTPHLLDIAKQGLRAKSMVPIFPTLTFPNHWALMTGLYAESHGLNISKNFWDPVTSSEFHYNLNEIAWKSSWWLGEPMWETAKKANIKTANLMWPGPPTTLGGASPTYFVPWRNHVPLDEKLDQIFAWIDLPLDQRPQFISAYEPSLDQAGHSYGPLSKQVNHTLATVDWFARDLHDGLVARNLTDIVDIVFVSDHGMADTSHPTLVYMDDILGSDGLSSIEHEDGWPSMGIRFMPGTNASHYLQVLEEQASKSNGAFEVFTHENMPERWHFSGNERIAPIYVVPKLGYALTTKAEGDTGMSKGNHGYDNTNPSMHAMFVAHGPFSSVVKTLHHQNARSWLTRPNKGWHSTADDIYVMESFQNVNIYNLVMKLLGAEEYAAPTNGTTGFWDKYF
ncbi:Phosphodiest-domain-containing protein [Flagelloscypha sp. PMI_526]|nr:Phosphodiest-domain-containing protein [Flagelloscypha sp. PMI_526]